MTKNKHHQGKKEDEWEGYFRCDDLVPPLCDDELQVTNGTVQTLKGVEVTYWRYTPQKLFRHKYPIIVVNGGPGLPHNFIKPTRNLACDGREVVMYDQAGTGASMVHGEADNDIDDDDTAQEVTEKYPELLTLEYYANTELPAILQELGWDKYHILAESWGSMVAFEFAVSSSLRVRDGLQSLILNAPIADNHKFIEYQWDPVDGSVGTLPTYTKERLEHFNDTQDFESDEYQQLDEVVMSSFNARLGVLVDCWMETEDAGISTIDYDPLTGPTDIFLPQPGVALRGWTVLPDLHKLHIPVQLNHGGYDMVRPRLIADTAKAIDIGGNYAECHVLPSAAHSILLDSPTKVFEYMKGFIRRLEAASRDKVPFQANGTCPIWNPQTGRVEYNSSLTDYSSVSEPHLVSSFPIMLFVLAIGVSFWLGIQVGLKRNKKMAEGYEHVQNASEQELEGGRTSS